MKDQIGIVTDAGDTFDDGQAISVEFVKRVSKNRPWSQVVIQVDRATFITVIRNETDFGLGVRVWT